MDASHVSHLNSWIHGHTNCTVHDADFLFQEPENKSKTCHQKSTGIILPKKSPHSCLLDMRFTHLFLFILSFGDKGALDSDVAHVLVGLLPFGRLLGQH